MKAFLETRDLVNVLAATILRLSKTLDEPLRLADLQALAGVNQRVRSIIGLHPDLVAAQQTWNECPADSHQKTAFEEGGRDECGNADEPVDERCDCYRKRSKVKDFFLIDASLPRAN